MFSVALCELRKALETMRSDHRHHQGRRLVMSASHPRRRRAINPKGGRTMACERLEEPGSTTFGEGVMKRIILSWLRFKSQGGVKENEYPNFLYSFDNCNFKPKSDIQKPLLDSFKKNIDDFLTDCDVVQDGHVWKWDFIHKEGCVKRTVTLFILREVVDDSGHKSAEDPFCIYCSYSGCSNNLVSKCKYLFVIPAEYESVEQLDGHFDTDDYFVRDQTHLLHGLIHSNGIGHLICINGRDGGSAFITGRDIMHLWDLLCLYFQARKVTVRDEAIKSFKHSTLIDGCREMCEGPMKTRLLFSVAFGITWFGRWGYTFLRGSYGVSRDNYMTAIESLGSLPLTEVEEIAEKYKKICLVPLECMRDLLSFMLQMRCGVRGQKRANVNKDMWTVYNDVLMSKDDVHTILNCKVFCKEIPLRQMSAEGLTVTFVVRDAYDNELPGMVGCEYTALPVEDVADLKGQVTDLIRDAYPALSNFTITEIEGEGTNELKVNMWVRGDGADMDGYYVAEGGRGWLVSCKCRAEDDDGEDMVKCDDCGNWKHIECFVHAGVELKDNVGWICSPCSKPMYH